MLQLALTSENKILYVSGEESENQIKMRFQRVHNTKENCLILTETSTQNIFQQIEKVTPEILIIDSIQTLQTSHIESSPGSVSQIRELLEMIKYAKQTGTAVFLIGHINKDGAIAAQKYWNIWLTLSFSLREIEIIFIGFLGQLKIDLVRLQSWEFMK